MPVTFVDDSETLVASANTLTANVPAGLVVGDLMILAVCHGFWWNFQQLPNGWTQLAKAADNGSMTLFAKHFATGDTSVTLNFAGTWSGVAWIGAYRGARLVTAAVNSTGTKVLTPAIHKMTSGPGTRLDLLWTRRDNAVGTVHNTPVWGTSRAKMDATDGTTRHAEVSVMERELTAWNADTNTWSLTNLGSYNDIVGAVWLAESSVLGAQVDTPIAGNSTRGPGWIYKGRASSLDDTVGAA
jgi:hypothetical protein